MRFEVHYDVHCSDREAVGVFGSGKHNRKHLFLKTLHGAHTGTPFFVDNTAFFVDFFRVQSQVVAPVMQNQQAGVDSPRSVDRYVGDIINRFVYGSICVQVFTEFYADTFQVLFQGISGKMGRSVETHVLEEVGKTALVVLFLYGTYFLGDIKVCPVGGKTVFTDVISQSVIQLADTDILVDGNGW